MSNRSVRVPFFDELLKASDIVPRIRSELETVLSRMSPDSPEYAKLQSLQCALSGNFRSQLSAAMFQALEHGMDYSDNFPDSVSTVHELLKKLEF